MSWLSIDKAPFIVTLLAGALAWTSQRTVTVLTEVPTISYSVRFKGSEIVATIENISRNQVFHDLRFHLQAENKDVFETTPGYGLTPYAPAMQPAGNFSAPVATPDDVAYPVPLLEPGWRFDLVAKRKTNDAAFLTVERNRSPIETVDEAKKLDADFVKEPVRMIESGVSTWIVKNELPVLLYLVALWFASVLICLWLFKAEAKSNT